jgi:hypothetical protein
MYQRVMPSGSCEASLRCADLLSFSQDLDRRRSGDGRACRQLSRLCRGWIEQTNSLAETRPPTASVIFPKSVFRRPCVDADAQPGQGEIRSSGSPRCYWVG